MSMTKRYLESLPAAEQDAILGGIDNAYIRPDEWTESAENEPLEQCAICGCAFSSVFEGIVCPDCVKTETNDVENEPTDEELAEWGRMLMEEDDEPVEAEDEELYDPLVKCRICRASRPISQMNTNGECAPCQREVALMVKPQGKCVEIEDHNGNTWKL